MVRTPVSSSGDDAAGGTRAREVYQRLLHAINSGQLGPGHRIRESEAASWLGVSRTPVREALRWLESEDILQRSSQGLTVATMSDEEVLELYELREVLEGMAAHCAAMRAGKIQVSRLRRVLVHFRRLRDDQLADIASANREFHVALAAASFNRYLSKTLDAMQDVFLRLPSTTFSVAGRVAKAAIEHENIVSAIERGEPAAAAAAARAHIRSSRRVRLRLSRQLQARASDSAPPWGSPIAPNRFKQLP